MKRLAVILVSFLILFSLCACDDEETEKDVKRVDVTFEMNSSKSTNDTVYMTTSLPIGMKLEVEIKQGKYDSVETVEVKGDIDGNYFQTEPQRDENDGSVKDGKYILRITSTEFSQQTAAVINQIGEKGEKLVGTCVFSDDETEEKFINYSTPLTLKNHNFSISR